MTVTKKAIYTTGRVVYIHTKGCIIHSSVKEYRIEIDLDIVKKLNQQDIKTIYKNIGNKLAKEHPITCATFVSIKNDIYVTLSLEYQGCGQGRIEKITTLNQNNLRQKMIAGFLKSFKYF